MKTNTKVITIEHRSEVDGELYSGQFTIRRLSVADVARVSTRRAQLNGGLYYDEDKPGYGIDAVTDSFNSMIAHLEVSIVAKPEWWNLETLYDTSLVSKVFKEVMEFEQSFRKGASTPVTAPVGQSGSVQAGQVTNRPGTYREMVGSEVQAALEP